MSKKMDDLSFCLLIIQQAMGLLKMPWLLGPLGSTLSKTLEKIIGIWWVGAGNKIIFLMVKVRFLGGIQCLTFSIQILKPQHSQRKSEL